GGRWRLLNRPRLLGLALGAQPPGRATLYLTRPGCAVSSVESTRPLGKKVERLSRVRLARRRTMSWLPCPRCSGYIATVEPDFAADPPAEERLNQHGIAPTPLPDRPFYLPPTGASSPTPAPPPGVPAEEVRRVAAALSSASAAARSGNA